MKSTSFLLGALLLAGLSPAQDPTPPAEGKKPAQAAQPAYGAKAVYPLDVCVVSGETIDASAVTVEAGGRSFKLCCDKCSAKLEKDVATYTKKLDEAIVAQQLPRYPLNTCPVSGEKLGGMGETTQLVVDGTLVQLCCAKCSKKATAEGAAIAQKVRDAAFAAQSAKYALKTCPVSGKDLGAQAVNTMFGTTLVRTCCPKCIAAIEKEPAKYLAKLAPAAAPAKEAAGSKEGGKEGKKDGEECCAADGGCAGGAVASAPADGEAKSGCCQDAKATEKPAEKAGGCCEDAKATGKPAEKPAEKAGCCCEGAKATDKQAEKKADCCEEAKSAGTKDSGKPAEKKAEKPAPKEPEKKIG
ncbi:MAG TPA: hypothetical protein VF384_17300 [Planctomycetota bacterium]